MMRMTADIRHFLRNLPKTYKRVLILGLDLVLIPLSLWVALSLRYGEWFTDFNRAAMVFAGLVVFTVPVFVKLGLYRAMMRFLGVRAMEQVATGVAASAAILLGIMLLRPEAALPRSTFVIYGMVLFVMIGGSRFLARRLLTRGANGGRKERVAIYGSGASGRQLMSLLRQGPDYEPVLFLDDADDLHGREVDGLRVLSPKRHDPTPFMEKMGVSSILLSMPSASVSRRRQVLGFLEGMPFHVRTVPGLDELLAGKAQLDQIQEVDIEDLLGREPVRPRQELMGKCITGKTVLVTGAGGSIGAELCRQVVAQQASRVILFDPSEYGLYRIDHELRRLPAVKSGEVEVVAILGSVLDEACLGRLFGRFAINTVYHAAAYKHVPLVEHNPFEGVRTNVLGTVSVARAAMEAGTNHFVLISTDKAVRPTNVMGASKRLAELVCQGMAQRRSNTVFSMVRFGNVLNSSGSVVPLFRRQIREGGPLTVTHPEVTRYFMTIPEAVQLVIQAGGMARGGDVFVLDMGEPVRIVDLARKIIRLSGLEVRDEANPHGDIEIEFTGLRPGEKLYEELLIGEKVSGTEHPRIARAEEDRLSWPELESALIRLRMVIDDWDKNGLMGLLSSLVDGYAPRVPAERPVRRVGVPGSAGALRLH